MQLIECIRRVRAAVKSVVSQYVTPYDKTKYGRIGKHTVVKNNSLLVPKNMYLDDYVVIQDKIHFISYKGKLIVGKYSVVSSGCIIVPGAHRLTVGVPFYLATMNHINDEEGDIIIDEDCWIGAGCILLPKIHIGRGAVVGAGSVVTKDIPPYAVVAGVPARIIATKFSLEQVLKHESFLYPQAERIMRTELETLFKEKYDGLKSIGVEDMNDKEWKDLEMCRYKVEMKNYSSIL